MGRSWAVVLARAGWTVRLYDPDPAAMRRARDFIDATLQLLAGDCPSVAAFEDRMIYESNFDRAVSECTYVQESVAESLDLKRRVVSAIAEAAPGDSIIASSTSSIPGREFMGAVRGPERCLIAHPLNPPHLIPLVELCPTPWTSHETLAAARQSLESVGQVPITLRREAQGFVVNRLQIALLMEALHLVDAGVCSVEDVDRAVTSGLALRWAVLGPLAAGHLNSDEGYGAYMRKYGAAIGAIAADLKVDRPLSAELIDAVDTAMRARYGTDIRALQAQRDLALARLRRQLDGAML